ncbi:hypothetical protein JP0017_15450 [Helicobacter pylori]
MFVGVYYIRNHIYINGGWEQKIKDLSDYTLEENKKCEIEVFFNFKTLKTYEQPYFGIKTGKGFLNQSGWIDSLFYFFNF